jgi:hypothetical protein
MNVLYKRFDLGNVLGSSRAQARSRFFDLTAGSLDLRITREGPLYGPGRYGPRV